MKHSLADMFEFKGRRVLPDEVSRIVGSGEWMEEYENVQEGEVDIAVWSK